MSSGVNIDRYKVKEPTVLRVNYREYAVYERLILLVVGEMMSPRAIGMTHCSHSARACFPVHCRCPCHRISLISGHALSRPSARSPTFLPPVFRSPSNADLGTLVLGYRRHYRRAHCAWADVTAAERCAQGVAGCEGRDGRGEGAGKVAAREDIRSNAKLLSAEEGGGGYQANTRGPAGIYGHIWRD